VVALINPFFVIVTSLYLARKGTPQTCFIIELQATAFCVFVTVARDKDNLSCLSGSVPSLTHVLRYKSANLVNTSLLR
jgi:hypothetical protein